MMTIEELKRMQEKLTGAFGEVADIVFAKAPLSYPAEVKVSAMTSMAHLYTAIVDADDRIEAKRKAAQPAYGY